MCFKSINPTTGKLIHEYTEFTRDEIEERLEKAGAAFQEWRHASFAERSSKIYHVADLLHAKHDQWADIMTREMGKPIAQARAEVDKCAWVCEYYAEHAIEFLQKESIGTDADRSYVRYEPLGPVLAVMPWNYPFWQVFRFAAPGLMAGNVALLSHAPNVTGCALAIEETMRSAGVPEGVFQTLIIGNEATHRVLEDHRVEAATLTGSVEAGKAVAQTAGQNIKKTVLELGGSDPFIVLEDADIEKAASVGSGARCLNSGQSCIAAKRFVVVENCLQEFTGKFLEHMKNQKVGDPMDEETQIGPQVRADLRDNLHRQVQESLEQGAELLLGGEPDEGDGYFYPPTVLAGVRPGMPVYEEEVFGPVAAIIAARDESDAIRIANDTEYGLGASIWSRNIERAENLVGEIDAGCVFINELVKSDPRLPFGGIKKSGYGRELGRHGILEFVNAKTVWIAGS